MNLAALPATYLGSPEGLWDSSLFFDDAKFLLDTNGVPIVAATQPLTSDTQEMAVRSGIAAQGFTIVTTTKTTMTPIRVEQFYTTALKAEDSDKETEMPPLAEMIQTMTCAPTTVMLLEVCPAFPRRGCPFPRF